MNHSKFQWFESSFEVTHLSHDIKKNHIIGT